jgi:hypothetical protein
MKFAFVCVFICSTALCQAPSFQDSLLEHMTGAWILQGTIEGQPTVHDVTIDWVLAHQYLQLREVSQEKNADGSPAYEAIVYIGRDPQDGKYACLWLDVTSGAGLTGNVIGHGSQQGDNIPFLFTIGASKFHTTFAYARNNDTWRWNMDGEERGTLVPFARMTMTRK